jgi:DNA-binding MarR family transcriptional regulator
MAHMSREANLVGACALALAGRLPTGAADAALISLSTWLAGGTVERLARAVGLTHSGAVRLADRLEADALLERRAGPDGRTRALHLTPAGLRAAAALQAGRFASLEDALGVLDDQERAALAGLAEKLLARITAAGAAPGHTCRLCEPDVCGHPDRCPVTQAAH